MSQSPASRHLDGVHYASRQHHRAAHGARRRVGRRHAAVQVVAAPPRGPRKELPETQKGQRIHYKSCGSTKYSIKVGPEMPEIQQGEKKPAESRNTEGETSPSRKQITTIRAAWYVDRTQASPSMKLKR